MAWDCCRTCGRWAAHFWWFFWCCGFIIFSSLPRFTCIVDFIATFLIYAVNVRPNDPRVNDYSLDRYIEYDLEHWKFADSGISVVIISFIRSIVLFFCFAWRYNMYISTFYIATVVMLLSMFYLIFKMAFAAHFLRPLVIFSILITLSQYVSYVCVRRRDIRRHLPKKRVVRAAKPGIGPLFPIPTPASIVGSVTPSQPQAEQYHRIHGDDDDGDDDDDLGIGRATVGSHSLVPDKHSLMVEVEVEDTSELEPHDFVEGDSRFIRIDTLEVHYKLGGRNAGNALAAAARYAQDVKLRGRASPPPAGFPPPAAPSAVPSSSSSSEVGDSKASDRKPLAIILLHGFGSSVFCWRRVWSELTELADIVLAFDRPGFGLTSRPLKHGPSFGTYMLKGSDGMMEVEQENPYTMQYSVRMLLTLMDRFSIAKAVLIGHSTGGALALRAALTAPSRVAATVLIAPQIYTDGFPSLIRTFFNTKLGKQVAAQLIRSELGEMALRRAWQSRHIPSDVIINYHNNLRLQNWFEALMEMASTPGEPEKDKLSDRLAEINIPVLLLHSQGDRLVALAESRRAVATLPMAQFVVYDGTSHVPHEEFSELFLRTLRRFLLAQEGESGRPKEPKERMERVERSERPIEAPRSLSDLDSSGFSPSSSSVIGSSRQRSFRRIIDQDSDTLSSELAVTVTNSVKGSPSMS